MLKMLSFGLYWRKFPALGGSRGQPRQWQEVWLRDIKPSSRVKRMTGFTLWKLPVTPSVLEQKRKGREKETDGPAKRKWDNPRQGLQRKDVLERRRPRTIAHQGSETNPSQVAIRETTKAVVCRYRDSHLAAGWPSRGCSFFLLNSRGGLGMFPHLVSSYKVQLDGLGKDLIQFESLLPELWIQIGKKNNEGCLPVALSKVFVHEPWWHSG